MKVYINTKFSQGEHGPWLSLSDAPQKVLLETATEESGLPTATGKPAVKIGTLVFHFGQSIEGVTKYRVLALDSIVVCIQE